jgi:hypothetical protein
MDKQPEKSKIEEITIEAKNFFDFYKKDLGESIRKGKNTILLDFTKLTEFSNKLSEEILTIRRNFKNNRDVNISDSRSTLMGMSGSKWI